MEKSEKKEISHRDSVDLLNQNEKFKRRAQRGFSEIKGKEIITKSIFAGLKKKKGNGSKLLLPQLGKKGGVVNTDSLFKAMFSRFEK
jgi:hypothetical protein